MYSFQLNIGSLSTPVAGTGWVTVTPTYEGVSIEKIREKDEMFTRTELGGDLIFYGGDYDTLLALRASAAKCGIRVQLDSTTVFTGDLYLYGKWYEDSNKCELSVKPVDDYEEIMNSEKDKFNLINVTPKIKADIPPAHSKLTFTLTWEADKGWEEWLSSGYPLGYWGEDVYAREQAIYPDILADELIGTSGWIEIEVYDNGTKMIARTWSDGSFDAWWTSNLNMIRVYETISGSINDQVRVNGREATYLYTTTERLGPGVVTVYLDNATYYGYSGVEITRFRRLDMMLEQMVGEMDSSLTFDNDSFAYLYANDDLKNLLVCSMKDVILSAGAEPIEGNDKEEVKWRDVMEGLRMLQLFWRINSGKFELKHKSEYNQPGVGSNPDLTNYKGADWTPDDYRYDGEYKYYKIIRENVADNFDFRGVNLEVPKLASVDKKLEIGERIYYTDILGIFSLGTELFPNRGMCLITANLQATDITPVNGNTGGTELFTTYSASGNTVAIEQSGSSARFRHSSTVTCVQGEGVSVQFTADMTGTLYCFLDDGVGGGSVAKSDLKQVYDGYNHVVLNPTENGDFYITFAFHYIGTGHVSGTLTDIEYGLKYVCRGASGALTGSILPNAELSQANIDAGHGAYDRPDTPMTVNLATTTYPAAQLRRDKEIKLNAPIYNPDTIDEYSLITTGKGNIELKDLKIELLKGQAEITGLYR